MFRLFCLMSFVYVNVTCHVNKLRKYIFVHIAVIKKHYLRNGFVNSKFNVYLVLDFISWLLK